jgi:hypothetical protein
MFSLIITIISIALVAALAVATIYYGGTVFNTGNAKSSANAIIVAAQQLGAANTIYLTNNAGTRADYATLTLPANGYMANPPTLPQGLILNSIDTATGVISGTVSQTLPNVCDAINILAGGAASGGIVKTAVAGAPYGCAGPGTVPYVFSLNG